PRGPIAAATAPRHQPHQTGPRIVVPLYIRSALAVVAGLANWPFGPDGAKLRFEHFVQPVGDYCPPVGALTFNPAIALISTAFGVLGIGLAYAYWFRGAFHGATERFRIARAGHTVLVEKYYFDHLYTGVIAGGVSGPVA